MENFSSPSELYKQEVWGKFLEYHISLSIIAAQAFQFDGPIIVVDYRDFGPRSPAPDHRARRECLGSDDLCWVNLYWAFEHQQILAATAITFNQVESNRDFIFCLSSHPRGRHYEDPTLTKSERYFRSIPPTDSDTQCRPWSSDIRPIGYGLNC